MQTLFLDGFYYRNTLKGMERTAKRLAEEYDAIDFSDIVQESALARQYCILVLRVGEKSVETLASAEVSIGGIVHKLSSSQLETVYEQSKAGGGDFCAKAFLQTVLNPIYMKRELVAYLPSYEGDLGNDNPLLLEIADERILFCKLVFTKENNAIMILLDTALSPSAPVMDTLRTQLIAISVAIFFFSLLLAFLISELISRPIVKINRKARLLSEGNYNADFSGDGYREICELGETLNDTAEKLSAVERVQRELISNISHDLRTPLTMIKGYAEVMRDIESERTPENVQVIIDESERLSELVDDILSISKAQQGKEKYDLERFDLAAALSETVDRYRRLKRAEGFTFNLSSAPSATVYADKGKILQVICNLLNNAINYTKDKEVNINCFIRGNSVHVDIIDNGEGIPDSELPNIWQRYYKVDKNHERSRIGSGLGLSIVRGILEYHKASYGVESKIGEGSRFWFELPLSK